jgi:tRNA A58 N-methylase Trm61
VANSRLYLRVGWRCLEVGGGAGSITRWLSEATGTTGRVVATDIDTRFPGDVSADNVEIRRHDVTSDPLEEDAFDLPA